jgi:hypothetical protein
MRSLSLFAILLLFAGCAPDDPAPPADPDANDMEIADDGYDVDAAEWQANLQGRSGFEGVSGSATAHVRDGRTHVEASVSGAPADGTHPWHIHEGTCASGGGIVGDADAYPPLEIGDDGQASAEADIDVALQDGASYHVNVHASPDDLGTIVACGDLMTN